MYPQQYPAPQAQAPMTQAAPKRRSRILIGFIFAIIALLMIAIALFTPWWHAEISMQNALVNGTWSGDYGVQTFSTHVSGSVVGMPTQQDKTETVSQYNADFQSSYNGASSAFAGAFTLALYLTIVALIFVIIAIVVTILAFIGKVKPFLAGLVLVIAFILVLIAPIIMAVQLPGTCDTDAKAGSSTATNPWPSFMGSSVDNSGGSTTTKSWGPNIGWYMMIIGVVMLLLSAMLVFGARQPVSPAPAVVYVQQQQPVMAPQAQPYYPPTQPAGMPQDYSQPQQPQGPYYQQ